MSAVNSKRRRRTPATTATNLLCRAVNLDVWLYSSRTEPNWFYGLLFFFFFFQTEVVWENRETDSKAHQTHDETWCSGCCHHFYWPSRCLPVSQLCVCVCVCVCVNLPTTNHTHRCQVVFKGLCLSYFSFFKPRYLSGILDYNTASWCWPHLISFCC